MKTSDFLLISVLVAGGYFYLQRKKTISDQAGQTPLKIDPSVFPLKAGDKGIFVENIQKALVNEGGEIAHLVLAGGGVNGQMNEQTCKALKMVGFGVPLDETSYRQLVNNSSVLRNYAYVIDVDGTPLYGSVSNSYVADYGYGRDFIMSLPAKTYVGVATGNFQNGLIELSTTINTMKVKFWTPSEKIGLLSQAEYNSMKGSRLLEKSEEARTKLLKL